MSNNNGKVEREDCAPYQAEDGNCRTVDDESCNYAGVSVTSFYNKWYSTEEEMKELVFMAPTATSVMVWNFMRTSTYIIAIIILQGLLLG